MDKRIANSIGTNLRKSRQRRGLTQSAVAQKAGTNANYYAKLERGETVPSIKMLEKVVKALGVHSSDILPF